MHYLKKVVFFIFAFIFIKNTYGQNNFNDNYTFYQVSDVLKKDSEPSFVSKTDEGELIFVFEKPSRESKSHYSVFHYDSEGKLLKKTLFKAKVAHKIHLSNRHLHFIRYKKKTKSELIDDEFGEEQEVSKFYKTDFYILSSSLDDLKFENEYILWSSVQKEDDHWSYEGFDCDVYFEKNKENTNLLALTTVKYNTYKIENTDAVINVKANDEKKRKRNFSTSFYFNFMDKDLKPIFNKKIIATNNYGEFEIIQKIVDSESVYLLLETSDKKKTKNNFVKKKVNQSHYHLLRVDKNGHQFKTLDEFKYELSAVDFNFFKNQIFVTGMYSEKYNKRIVGFVKATIDKNTFEKTEIHYFKFSEDFLNDVKPPFAEENNSNSPRKTQPNSSQGVDYRTFKSLRTNQLHIDENGNCNIIIEEYEILKNSGAPMMGGMPGMAGGMMVAVSIGINTPSGEERQLGYISAKISSDNKLTWSRRTKNKEKKNNLHQVIYVNDVSYIIRKHTPKTHKLYKKSDKKDKTKRFYYALSFSDFGIINSYRFAPFFKKSDSYFIKGEDDHIYIVNVPNETFVIKKLNHKR